MKIQLWILFLMLFCGCAHVEVELVDRCRLPSDSQAWQLDRVEPPWAVLLAESGDLIHLPQSCFDPITEGMIFVDGRRQREMERRLAHGIRNALSRLINTRGP